MEGTHEGPEASTSDGASEGPRQHQSAPQCSHAYRRDSGLLKLTLSLGFCLDHRDNLGTGIHQFWIGQHTSAARKVLKARAEQHQVIAGCDAAPSLDDMAALMAPDGVSLPYTLSMAQGGACAAEDGPGHPVWAIPPHRAGNEGGDHRNHGEGGGARRIQPL